MTDEATLDIVRQSLVLTLKIAAPVLAAGVIVGLTISILQSVTQIQEQTLTLIPKIVVMVIVAVLLLPWIVARISEFAVSMLNLA